MTTLKSELEKLTDSLISGDLEIYCKRITFTQKTTSKAKIRYSAPGRIVQSSDGKFKIHIIYAKNHNFRPITSSDLCPELKTGELFPEQVFFYVKCLAVDGQTWTNQNVWLDAEIYHNTQTALITGECDQLESRSRVSHSIEKPYCSVTCKVKNFRFPNNEFSDYGYNGRTRNLSKFEIKNNQFSILTNNSNIKITITSNKTISKKTLDSSLNSLEILSGMPLEQTIKYERYGFIAKTTIKPPDKEGQFWQLPPPLQCTAPHHLTNCVDFIEKIMNQYKTLEPRFYYYWRELGLAMSTSLEAFALCVSVNVEGMVDCYFSTLRAPDPEFVRQCKIAKEHLEINITPNPAGPITQKVKDKLLNSLSNANASSAKNALYKIFDKNIVDSWNRIRHPAAHGSLAEKNLDNQILFDCSNSCLHMFYEMLIRQINFEGERRNFSTKGYPLISQKL